MILTRANAAVAIFLNPQSAPMKNKPKRILKRWWVYMVRCSDGTLYTGATNNVAARVATHNAGKGARYTRSRLPVKLVFEKAQKHRSAALSFEAELKKLNRTNKLRLITFQPSTGA
jgi:predicted GIY-YIG superfamily endonuclease